MDQKQIVKQMVDFNKATFENAYNAMTLVQEQAERLGQTTLEQASWLPEEGKKAMNDLVEAYKQGRENLKKNVDEARAKVEGYFDSAQK